MITDYVTQDLRALKTPFRLLMLSSMGALPIAVMAGGGADAVAKTLVEAPAWKVSTRTLSGSASLDRLVVTTDVDVARVQIQNAHLELASQPSQPADVPGLLWYDSTTPHAGKLKFYNGTSWVEGGGGGAGAFTQRYIIAPPATCTYSIGAGGAAALIGGTGGNGGTTTFTFGSTTITAPGDYGGTCLSAGTTNAYTLGGLGESAGLNGDICLAGERGGHGLRNSAPSMACSREGASTKLGVGGTSMTSSGQGNFGQGSGSEFSGAYGGVSSNHISKEGGTVRLHRDLRVQIAEHAHTLGKASI